MSGETTALLRALEHTCVETLRHFASTQPELSYAYGPGK